jgi:hypothetical protein
MGDTPTKPPPVSRISQGKIEEMLARAKKSIERSRECIQQARILQKSSQEMIAGSRRRQA